MSLFNKLFKNGQEQNKITDENVNKINASRLSENDIYSLTTFPYNFEEEFKLPLSTAQKNYMKKEIFKWYEIYFKVHSVDIIKQFKSRISDEKCLAYYGTHPEEYQLLVSNIISKHLEELLDNLFKDYQEEDYLYWKPVLHNGLWHPNQKEYSNFIMNSLDMIEYFIKEEIALEQEDLAELIKINDNYLLKDEEKMDERNFLIKTYIDFYKEEIMKNSIERLLMEYYNFTKYGVLKETFQNNIYIEYHTAFDCNNYSELFKNVHKKLKAFFKTNNRDDLLDWFINNIDEILSFILDHVSHLSTVEQKKLTYKDLSKYALSLDTFIIAIFKINLDGFNTTN